MRTGPFVTLRPWRESDPRSWFRKPAAGSASKDSWGDVRVMLSSKNGPQPSGFACSLTSPCRSLARAAEDAGLEPERLTTPQRLATALPPMRDSSSITLDESWASSNPLRKVEGSNSRSFGSPSGSDRVAGHSAVPSMKLCVSRGRDGWIRTSASEHPKFVHDQAVRHPET